MPLWLLASAACTLLLGFDPDGLPCDQEQHQACLEGYSCASKAGQLACVGDHTLEADASCQLDRQCKGNTICPTRKCMQACDANQSYANTAGCPTGRYCKPSFSRAQYSGNPDKAPRPQLAAVCAPTDSCTFNTTCPLVGGGQGVCVFVSATATACVPRCEITFAANTYGDNCGDIANFNTSFDSSFDGVFPGGYPSHCQALGPASKQALVCIPAPADSFLKEGQKCTNAAATPCDKGLTCMPSLGVCVRWCDPAGVGCAATQHCCEYFPTPEKQMGYCVNGDVSGCPGQ